MHWCSRRLPYRKGTHKWPGTNHNVAPCSYLQTIPYNEGLGSNYLGAGGGGVHVPRAPCAGYVPDMAIFLQERRSVLQFEADHCDAWLKMPKDIVQWSFQLFRGQSYSDCYSCDTLHSFVLQMRSDVSMQSCTRTIGLHGFALYTYAYALLSKVPTSQYQKTRVSIGFVLLSAYPNSVLGNETSSYL